MKNAIFVGYKEKDNVFNFTKGKTYPIRDGLGIEYITDDDDYDVPFNDVTRCTYDFFISDSEVSSDLSEKPASLKYLINGIQVEKLFFYESIGELNEAGNLGAKVSSVNFEIKFE